MNYLPFAYAALICAETVAVAFFVRNEAPWVCFLVTTVVQIVTVVAAQFVAFRDGYAEGHSAGYFAGITTEFVEGEPEFETEEDEGAHDEQQLN